MIIRSNLAGIVASAILSYSVPAFADKPAHPPQIGFSANQLYPETASWSAKENVFFVSSVRHGTVGKVTLDGKYTPFISDDKLISTVGLLADDAHNTLWVTNSDPGAGDRTNAGTQGKLAGVAAMMRPPARRAPITTSAVCFRARILRTTSPLTTPAMFMLPTAFHRRSSGLAQMAKYRFLPRTRCSAEATGSI
jgi:hypothetical protein